MAVDPELFDFIAESMRYSRDSEGAFDITVGPLMKAWGFFRGEGRMPSVDELATARRHVGASHVVLDPAAGTIAFDEPGVELDLGGIAKGYAVDRVVGLLKERGVPAALVSAGGSTIYGLGAPPGRAGWEVAIQDPAEFDPDRADRAPQRPCAVRRRQAPRSISRSRAAAIRTSWTRAPAARFKASWAWPC